MGNYTTRAVFVPAREAVYAPAGWKTVPPKNPNFVGRSIMLGPEWISLDLLHRGRLGTPFSRRLDKTLRDQAPLQRAVKDIARWELARNDTRNLRFQIHRLVQRMVQVEMAPELRAEVRETVQTMLAHANPGNPDRIAPMEQDKHAQLSAHIVASGLIESEDDEARQVVLDQIRYRYIVGDYESSRGLPSDAPFIWGEPLVRCGAAECLPVTGWSPA